MNKAKRPLFEAIEACVRHARDLLAVARAGHDLGRFSIAYHLATLCLEEMGRREMLLVNSVQNEFDQEGFPKDATNDHVKKLFWCFFRMTDVAKSVEHSTFLELMELAQTVHRNRVRGLYVDAAPDGLNIPSEQISEQQSERHLSAAESFLKYAECQKPREVPLEEKELQIWFMRNMDDPERRKRVINSRTLLKLKELNEVPAWAKWVRAELEREDAALHEMAVRELSKGPADTGSGSKDRWKIRMRVETQAHSIRAGVLKEWNESVRWVKFVPVQGSKSKTELILEITLGDNVPMGAVWTLGLRMAERTIMALNLATSGFWWWSIPRQRSRYYDKIEDLETRHELQVEQSDLKVFWDRRPALTRVHMHNLMLCLGKLPDPDDTKRAVTYGFYLAGLTFLSISDVHMRCEPQAFGNFVKFLRELLVEAEYMRPGETAADAMGRALKERYAELDQDQYEALVRLMDAFEGGLVSKQPRAMCIL